MKELSIEEKAKAYDEALKVLHKYDGAHIMFTQDLKEEMFPELREESEDERIRKALINQFSDYKRRGENHGFGYSNDKILAWLEKQAPINEEAEKEKNDYVSGQFLYCKGSFNEFKEGESYWIEYIGNDTYIGRSDNILNQKFHITPRQLYTWLDPRHPEKQDEQKPTPKFRVGDKIWHKNYKGECMHHIIRIENNNYIGDDNTSISISTADKEYELVEKQGEQKPAWSEEDEYTLGETIQHLEELIRIEKVKHCGIDVQYYQRDIDWLKSLRPQNRWKPSDEQMKALENAMSMGAKLNSLYNELKKLKG